MPKLIFLKLGGSLITDKTQPYTPRLEKLDDLARQIAAARRADSELSLVLGHGSGSFGHTAAKQYRTRDGLPRGWAASDPLPTSPIPAPLAGVTPESDPLPTSPILKNKNGGGAGQATLTESDYWRGFAEVWFQASALNRFVMEALQRAGLPALALAPVAAVIAQNGKVGSWDLTPIKSALAAGLLPVVFGDVIFDNTLGGTILSTEDLFEYLSRQLKPERILLAGLEGAVWADYPQRTQRVEIITPASFDGIKAGLGASHGADVTGGMESKVRQMLTLVREQAGLSIQIFSGEQPGNIQKTLAGDQIGTQLRSE